MQCKSEMQQELTAPGHQGEDAVMIKAPRSGGKVVGKKKLQWEPMTVASQRAEPTSWADMSESAG